MALPITSRKRDLIWLVYFCIHLPVMFAIDLQSLYPPSLVPTALTALKEWHIKTNQDLFFVSPPPFFRFFMWMEVFFHVPICVWSIRGLWKGNSKTPLVLLIYAVQTFVSTAACMAEYMAWPTVDFDGKMKLTSLYGPYIAVSVLMGIDASLRISGALSKSADRDSEILTRKKTK